MYETCANWNSLINVGINATAMINNRAFVHAEGPHYNEI